MTENVTAKDKLIEQYEDIILALIGEIYRPQPPIKINTIKILHQLRDLGISGKRLSGAMGKTYSAVFGLEFDCLSKKDRDKITYGQ